MNCRHVSWTEKLHLPEPSYSPEKPGQEGREFVISKKVITERDLIAAKEQKVCCVVVDQKAILTDLAREYAGKTKDYNPERLSRFI